MSRKDLKTRTPIGSAVKTELLEELRALSKETDIPISKLLDRAITMLLESTKK